MAQGHKGREDWEWNMDAQDAQDFGIDSRKAREGRKERRIVIDHRLHG